MAEYGEKPRSEWPQPGTPEYDRLPGNALIALRRLNCALKEDKTTSNSEYVEPRARAVEQSNPDPIPLIAGIAAAIIALKQSGVQIRPAIETDVEK